MDWFQNSFLDDSENTSSNHPDNESVHSLLPRPTHFQVPIKKNPYLLMMLENEIQNDAVASFYRSGSDLSAALSSTDILEAELIIMDYNPINRQDKTKDVLQSFLTYLPEDGKSALAAIILEHSSDHAALKGLSNHLYATILLPSKY